MTQMSAAAASTSSTQCFSQASSELASPEDSLGGSLESSTRDRSHLSLDLGKKRDEPAPNGVPPGFNFLGLKPRTNYAAPLTSTANGFSETGLSPMHPKDFIQVFNAIMSPANRRPNFSLPLQQSAFNNLQQKQSVNTTTTAAVTPSLASILDTPNEAKEFARGFTQVLEELQQKNHFNTSSLASPSTTGLLLPLINALTPTNPQPPLGSSAANAESTLLNLIAALTPTPTQSNTTFAAALASLAGTPNNPSPPTNFPPILTTSQPSCTTSTSINHPLPHSTSSSVTVATGGNQASAPIPTTTSTAPSSQALGEIYKNLDSTGLMDHMFPNHPDISFPGLMSHFGHMPPHSQSMPSHNGYGHQQQQQQQQQLGVHQGPPQQPGLVAVKQEPGVNVNGYGHSLQGAAATGMCQPPPQNLSCAPSTSSHQMASYQAHLSNSSLPPELELNEQERRKLERKRARNRMAASKCRQRKIERIQQLEGEVQQERQRYQSLQNSITSMEKTIAMLQNELTRHKHAGCTLEKSTLNLMSHLSSIINNNNSAVPMDIM